MNDTNTHTKPIDLFLVYACGFFTSDDDCKTNEEMLEVLASGDPGGRVTFWEPFEHSDPAWIAQQIESMANGLKYYFVPKGANNE